MISDTTPRAIWDRELAAMEKPPSDWLWHGFLGHGNLTLLTHKLNSKQSNGPWLGKAGKREGLEARSISACRRAYSSGIKTRPLT